ncbi:MAG: AI-2E family transporter [Xanthomonadaceae bacterium]|nr:AI-2E family transporter [Xanthomonadaceae bacterium]
MKNSGISKSDVFKILFILAMTVLTFVLLAQTPSLGTAVLLSIVFSILLTPVVSAVERKGYSRSSALTVIYILLVSGLGMGAYLGSVSLISQWDEFSVSAPQYFDSTLKRLETYEQGWKDQYPFLKSVQIADSLKVFKDKTTGWFLSHGAGMLGNILTLLFLVPIISFVLLKDGRRFRKRFYELVPNRFFETTFMVSHQITASLSDYIRAKLVEALLVGIITAVGLGIIDAPYALVLAGIAGVTNIVPYVGPLFGAIPGILIVAAAPEYQHLLWPVVAIYLIANVVDTVLIFPLLVAKLVNLHPLLLIGVVMIGQEYYGLIGMLISIPIATALKVIVSEIYYFVYGQSSFTAHE